jgi:hypothetical protein
MTGSRYTGRATTEEGTRFMSLRPNPTVDLLLAVLVGGLALLAKLLFG